jgi:hypothetical protein
VRSAIGGLRAGLKTRLYVPETRLYESAGDRMELAVFVVAFVSVSIVVVMFVLGRKVVRLLGSDIESLSRKVDVTLRDELMHLGG